MADGLEARQALHQGPCEAQLKVAEKEASKKETVEFPLFLDYTDEIYAAVEEYAAEERSPRLC